MIDPLEPDLSIAKQCRLMSLSRSSFYYKSKPIKPEDLKYMRLIDELYLKHPCWGSRSMRDHLRRLGYKVNRKYIQRLMRLMGIEAIYPKPRTSRPYPENKSVSVFAPEPDHRPAQPGVDSGYHLYSNEPGLHVSGRHYGLVQPQGFILADIQQPGYVFLCGSPARSFRALWTAGNL